MKSLIARTTVVGLLSCIGSIPAFSSDTIMPGSDPGPNATGEITAYTGNKGLACPVGYESGDYLPSPYKEEKPLFRIDHSNLAQYENRLSAGQIARMKRSKNFYLNIYPTHRHFEFPEEVYTAIQKNQETCSLNNENELQNYNGAVAFPIPENGVQAAWNIKRFFSGEDAYKYDTRRLVSPSGRIRKEIQYTQAINLDENRLLSELPNPDDVASKIISLYTYPADKAGGGVLIHQYKDDRPDDTWLYLPTLRRVRRAPTLDHGAQVDGESTMDEIGAFFRGRINDWDWKLLGKKEMYVPANNYEMWKLGAPDNEECLPGDINPESLRYELRRVWVVEATAKDGTDHPYSKRVLHADEDNWYVLVGDNYDKRGNLWRMSEFYTYYDYCTQYRVVNAMMYLNLESGRYEFFGGGLDEDSKATVTNSGMKASDFTVPALRRSRR
jgi:Protein of unknown function (DUF1329)